MSRRKFFKRRRTRKYALAGGAILILAAGLWLAIALAVQSYAGHRLQAFIRQYGAPVRYRSVSLKGFDRALIRGLSLASGDVPFLLYARTLSVEGDFRKSSFTPGKDIRKIEINGLHLHYTFRADPAGEGEVDYASLAEKVAEAVSSLPFGLVPEVRVSDVRLSWRTEGQKEHTWHIPRLLVAGRRFVAEMQQSGSGSRGKWICRGVIEGKPLRVSLRLYATDGEKISLPLPAGDTRASAGFDTLALDLQGGRNRGGLYALSGKAGVKGLILYHPGLAADTVSLGKGLIHYRLLVGKNFVEADSSATLVRYNRVQFKPYLRLERNEKWRLRLAVDRDYFPAGDFFASLPQGLFRHLEGLKVSGELAWRFLLDVDMTQVSNLVFESVPRTRNFEIIAYGNTDLRKMSGPFVHTVYSRGQAVRRFEVGSRNPDFRPLASISRYLAPAIMHAEDFAFYSHRGFYPEAFHKSLVENIEARSFMRGASTLSMQLVKNVFLSPDKTMARKLEEILIVWLIENNRLTSKARMFEVYMNIIEWGPNVYGITEAARFYFAKDPSELTLSECIFLAYIIPFPKYIRNHFNGLRLKYPYYEFFSDALRRLGQRGLITPSEAALARPEPAFSGPVNGYLRR